MASSSHDEFSQMLDEEFDNIFQEEFDNSLNSFEEHQQPRKPRKKRVHIERYREEGHIRLWNDYFGENAIFPPNLFRRRFRMNRHLFMRIVDRLTNEIPFFPQRRDATGRLGLSPLQKCTGAIRMLAYGCAADAVDEYLRIGETTSMKCMQHFVDGIIFCFGDEYLRKPTAEDLQRLLIIGEIRGFPGMMGSIDCMHWEWKNCPTAWKGQYTRASVYTQFDVTEFQQAETSGSTRVDFSYETDMPSNMVDMMTARTRVRDRNMHEKLKNDLAEHIWRKFSRNQV